MSKVKRPPVRWFGSKWIMAPRVIPLFPSHRVYVEPFGGAACVLMRKVPSKVEVYNDLDQGLVNVFRVLRDPEQAERLRHACHFTPFSRVEHELTYEPTDDPVEAARRFIFRSYSSFGSSAHVRVKTGFRSRDNAAYTRAWARWPENVAAFVERLRGVVIECRDAVEVIRMHDGPEALFYVDPPYVHSTRKPGAAGDYAHEMTDEQHRRLAAALKSVEGSVVLSGYRSDLYDAEYGEWKRVDFDHYSGNANAKKRARTESVWLNARAADAMHPTLELGA